jgi:hypothetical protein
MASIAVCNLALAEIRAPVIVSLDDGSPEADACAQHYDDCLSTLLECHQWSFAKKRVSLALLATNDRSGEWAYAYAAPADMAAMGVVVYATPTPPVGVYFPWPYDWPRPPFYLTDFIFDGTTIYTNLQNAVLEYSSNNVEESLWPAMFRRAVALDLASRLAITILDDRAKKGDFLQQHEAAKRRAMADDLNRYPKRDAPAIDDVAMVRR